MTKNHKKEPAALVFILITCAVVLFALSVKVYLAVSEPGVMSYQEVKEAQLATPTSKMIPFSFNNIEIATTADEKFTVVQRMVNPTGNRAAALLVNDLSGSGVFYYLVGGSLVKGVETYSKPILLGDRITFESLMVGDDGITVVTFLDRAKNEPMSAEPTKKMTVKYAFQDNGDLISVLH